MIGPLRPPPAAAGGGRSGPIITRTDLKTPLTGLSGSAQLVRRLIDRGQGLDPDRLLQRLTVVDEQAVKLARLIEQLLDVTRLDAGRLALEPAPTDLAALIAKVAAEAQGRTEPHVIAVRADESIPAVVDPLRLEQVLTNLLDNATRYSPDGLIEVAIARPEPARVRIEVCDHGPGVPEGQREHLFERFFPVDGLTARTGLGLGLGRHISRQIVRQHGGELSARFPPSGGSQFCAELPVDPPETRAEP